MPVADLDLAFPARALELMPTRGECDAGLAALPAELRDLWLDFQSCWFAFGLTDTCIVGLNEGIDGVEAFRHLRVIQGSYAPKHQHKEVAVAYLCSLWFTGVANYRPEPTP